MEFTARITKEARIGVAKGGKQVVNFTVAINDRYKVKGTGEVKELTTFIEVEYWRSTGVASILTTGSVVTISGRLYPGAYMGKDEKPVGTIHCNADNIKLVHFSKKVNREKAANPVEPSPAALTEPLDDLPF